MEETQIMITQELGLNQEAKDDPNLEKVFKNIKSASKKVTIMFLDEMKKRKK